MNACLVTYIVFVRPQSHIPNLLYRKFGVQRAKVLGNVAYLLENCPPASKRELALD